MMNRRSAMALGLAALAAPHLARAGEAFADRPHLKAQIVGMGAEWAPGQIVVMPRQHFLYWIDAPGRAVRYGVGVGRAGLEFTGRATIDVKKKWPTWRPTDEMIARDPRLYSEFRGTDYVMPGGPRNPLGARALYLFQNGRNTFYAIHGTNAPASVGQSVSNGCIRMLNAHAVDLYARVPIGTPVTVVL
jgi:lipoprotein-anchoring transpeptidase ErfK/SrfK